MGLKLFLDFGVGKTVYKAVQGLSSISFDGEQTSVLLSHYFVRGS